MRKLTELQTIRLSKLQKETLRTLKVKCRVNIQDFIRIAIKEKI